MTSPSRRDLLKTMGAAGAGLALSRPRLFGQADDPIVIAGEPVDVTVDIGYQGWAARTVRLLVRPIRNGSPADPAFTGALAFPTGTSVLTFTPRPHRSAADIARVTHDDLTVRYTSSPPTFTIETAGSRVLQKLTLDATSPTLSFLMPTGPLLGLGEGGAQFDRKGHTDAMRNGQVTSRTDGYSLAVNGTRAPAQWLIGTGAGWAMFIHQPYGSFDFTGDVGRFTLPAATPAVASVVNSTQPTGTFLPLDIFIVASDDPATILREYANITGFAAMPPRWALGYLQSHRTLAGRDEVMGVAKTFREKKLPCDGLIYLGTDFTPSGWNTHNGEFTWHPTNFPDPKAMLDELHDEHFKVVLHIVVEGRTLTGPTAGIIPDPAQPGTATLGLEPCTAPPLPPGRTPDGRWPPDRQASCYWPAHKPLMDLGVDGWWPDQGDGFDGPSRFRRHEMYVEGTQLYRPDDRVFALHRNASPGIQRFGSFIWSGDVQSRWDTLQAHVPDGINAGLSGFPYWGTDIGGFYGTSEYTGELFVRWFQFGAFCPLFRSHGRNWHLHLPWGWDGGDGGPNETQGFTVDPAELHNPHVETICRQYLELRYRLLPYLYTAVRETCDTGLPIMRALWLHHPDDPIAVARGDEYLWGRDLLVAPVVEKGAASRRVYLPRGTWIDFWTNERVNGGREITRPVTLETMPIYVRAGAVVPMGPVRQYADEPSTEPITLMVYPGADGSATWYEDDGRAGPRFLASNAVHESDMRVALEWRDTTRSLTIRLAANSRLLGPTPRAVRVTMAGSTATKDVMFGGTPTTVNFEVRTTNSGMTAEQL